MNENKPIVGLVKATKDNLPNTDFLFIEYEAEYKPSIRLRDFVSKEKVKTLINKGVKVWYMDETTIEPSAEMSDAVDFAEWMNKNIDEQEWANSKRYLHKTEILIFHSIKEVYQYFKSQPPKQ